MVCKRILEVGKEEHSKNGIISYNHQVLYIVIKLSLGGDSLDIGGMAYAEDKLVGNNIIVRFAKV